MDNALTLTMSLAGLGTFLGMVLHGLFTVAQPTLDLLVPACIAYLVHRYVKNQTEAAILTDMAGSAYSHIGAQFAAGGPITFGSARTAAVAAVVAGMDTAAQAALVRLSQRQIAVGVDAKLGQILASDPTFNVTDPQGKSAAKTTIAAAMAVSASSPTSPLVQVADVGAVQTSPGSNAVTPAAPAAPAAPAGPAPNFDIAGLVQEAVREGMAAALHNGALR